MYKLIAIPVVLLGLTGCAGFAFGVGQPVGALYTQASTGGRVTDNNIGKKKGEACATSILGLVTTGDASIRAAADAGNIRQISSVDSSMMNILGLYAKYCTIVSGTGE
jgi:TRL-like protein family